MLANNTDPFSSLALPGWEGVVVAAPEVVAPEVVLLEPASFTGPTIPPCGLKVGSVVLLTLAAAALNSSRVLELSEL